MSALFFGVHMLRSEYHSKHLDREDAIPLISLQLAVTCAFSVAWALLAEGEEWGGVLHQLTNGEATGVLQAAAAAPWIPMIYTGLLSTALCLWIEVRWRDQALAAADMATPATAADVAPAHVAGGFATGRDGHGCGHGVHAGAAVWGSLRLGAAGGEVGVEGLGGSRPDSR